MTSVGAIREMVVENLSCARDATKDPWAHMLNTWHTRLVDTEQTSDAALMDLVRKIDASAIGRRDIAPLADALIAECPDFDLRTLSTELPADVLEKLWTTTSMICMLTATLSMVPPEMLTQIESMAKTMAAGLSGGEVPDLGTLFSGMMGGAGSQHGIESPPAPSRRRSRPSKATKQDEFRRRLV